MIERYFSDETLARIKSDFSFLMRIINESYGEFDIAIRNNYFNIYYKGNSLVKISPHSDKTYSVKIHSKFFNGTKADSFHDIIKKNKEDDTYRSIKLTPNQLHPFLQKRNLNEFASRIKATNYGEEIVFEQALITDNLDRDDFILIDRQITDRKLNKKRMDLLALRQIDENKYHFEVVEVKLGNNTELKGKVVIQLKVYTDHLNKYFEYYKECYEKQYSQKKELKILKTPKFDSIEIHKPVESRILVVGYSVIAEKYITELGKINPSLNIQRFKYRIT